MTKGKRLDIIFRRDNAGQDPLAQLAEHLTFNQGVRGSNPRWFTNKAEESTTILFSALFYLIVFLTISDCY